jgi:hypothetical protein
MSEHPSQYHIPSYSREELDFEVTAAYEHQPVAEQPVATASPEREPPSNFAVLHERAQDIEQERKKVDERTFFTQINHETGIKAILKRVGITLRPALKEFTIGDLMTRESAIGSEIVSDNASIERRTFFYEKEDNWFYVRTYTDALGKEIESGYRYEVNDDHVLRIIDGGHHARIDGLELERFDAITAEYHRRVMVEMYQPVQSDYGLAS